jgi:hypothetical protein
MTFTLANIKAAGSRVTEFHAPFKAEGTDIRNAFGVIVGAGIDEVHADIFAAAGNTRAALEAAEHWIEEQAWSPIAENGEILRTIREALGKPHDAPDAAPAAPQTPDASALMLAALKSLFQHHPSAFVVSCGLPLTPELAAKPEIMALQAALRAIRAAEGREG